MSFSGPLAILPSTERLRWFHTSSYRVEPWVKEHPRTLRQCIDTKVSPRDLADDRLATILDYLCVAERWGACERELNEAARQEQSVRQRVARAVMEINALQKRILALMEVPRESYGELVT